MLLRQIENYNYPNETSKLLANQLTNEDIKSNNMITNTIGINDEIKSAPDGPVMVCNLT